MTHTATFPCVRIPQAFSADNGKAEFSADLSRWATQRVTSLESTFHGAKLFNSNIGGWVTSSVKTLKQTFYDAVAFSQELGGWDVSSVTSMCVCVNPWPRSHTPRGADSCCDTRTASLATARWV